MNALVRDIAAVQVRKPASMFRFTIRDLLWLIVVVGISLVIWIGWSREVATLKQDIYKLKWHSLGGWVIQAGRVSDLGSQVKLRPGERMVLEMDESGNIKMWPEGAPDESRRLARP